MFRNDSDTQKKIDNEAGLAPCCSSIKGLLKMSANKISERVWVKLLLYVFLLLALIFLHSLWGSCFEIFYLALFQLYLALFQAFSQAPSHTSYESTLKHYHCKHSYKFFFKSLPGYLQSSPYCPLLGSLSSRTLYRALGKLECIKWHRHRIWYLGLL